MSIIENIKKIRINNVDDIKLSAENFRDIVHALCGLKIAASHNIARSNTPIDKSGELLATSVFGWEGTSKDWWKTESLALNSPIITACRYENEPFWINGQGIYSRTENHFLKEIDLVKFTQRAMTHAAIVVPVHMPFGQIGAVSFNPISKEHHDLTDFYDKYSEELGIYSHSFINSYVNVSARTPLLPIKSKLYRREVECLRWAALGKTDHEISLILERSRATVRFHIHNATTKLDAVNKSQAVFKATQLGYISIKR